MILIMLLSVFNAFSGANNIHSMHGKVDKVIKSSSKINGDTTQTITIVDSDNKKKVLHTNNKIKNFNVNKGDNIKVDYLPTKMYEKASGTILGFTSSSR